MLRERCAPFKYVSSLRLGRVRWPRRSRRRGFLRLPRGSTVPDVQIDMLRRGWPEQLLTGRYTFTTRRRDGLVQGLYEAVDLLTDGLIDKRRKRQLHIRFGAEPALMVLKEPYPQ